MRRLIEDRPPAGPVLWLTQLPFVLRGPGGDALALHLARPAPSAVLRLGDRCVPAGPRAGWLTIEAPPEAPFVLRAEGAPLPLSLDARARPALRVWAGQDGANGAANGAATGAFIPESHWRAARVLGPGGLAALGAGPARPLLRLGPGEAAWVTLPALDWPALPAPRLEVLRGPAPRHALHWGEPGAARARGPAPLTLALRAGLACELLWRS